jgi:hypothetical protein
MSSTYSIGTASNYRLRARSEVDLVDEWARCTQDGTCNAGTGGNGHGRFLEAH